MSLTNEQINCGKTTGWNGGQLIAKELRAACVHGLELTRTHILGTTGLFQVMKMCPNWTGVIFAQLGRFTKKYWSANLKQVNFMMWCAYSTSVVLSPLPPKGRTDTVLPTYRGTRGQFKRIHTVRFNVIWSSRGRTTVIKIRTVVALCVLGAVSTGKGDDAPSRTLEIFYIFLTWVMVTQLYLYVKICWACT